jgi:MATE family multidrug resistance protein
MGTREEGEETLAMMVLLLQFIIWFAFSLDGFANAAESLVGKFYGAKEWKNFYRVIRLIFYWALGFTLFYMVVYALFTRTILELYTNQASLINTTMSLLPYLVAMPLLSFVAYVWDGVFVGMTATKAMRNSVIIGAMVYVTFFYMTKSIDFTYALWLSFLLFFLVRGVMQTLLFVWKGKRLE